MARVKTLHQLTATFLSGRADSFPISSVEYANLNDGVVCYTDERMTSQRLENVVSFSVSDRGMVRDDATPTQGR